MLLALLWWRSFLRNTTPSAVRIFLVPRWHLRSLELRDRPLYSACVLIFGSPHLGVGINAESTLQTETNTVSAIEGVLGQVLLFWPLSSLLSGCLKSSVPPHFLFINKAGNDLYFPSRGDP
jgi:hypothetical protein